MLKSESKITDVVIENMMNWPPARRALSLRLGERHSGFNVYCGKAIWPHNEVRRRRRKFSPLNMSAVGGSSERLFPKSA
jgi:hypothetical protein